MSRIVETKLGRFRAVTDGQKQWWLWECPRCKDEWMPLSNEQMNGESSVVHDHYYGLNKEQYCGYHETHEFGKELVVTMQANVFFNEPVFTEDSESLPATKEPACEWCDHPSGYFEAYDEKGDGVFVHRGRDNDAQICTATAETRRKPEDDGEPAPPLSEAVRIVEEYRDQLVAEDADFAFIASANEILKRLKAQPEEK